MRKKTLIFSGLAVAALLAGAAVANHGHKHGHGPHAERMFERLDSNNDGSVTLEEAKAHAVERFNRADADGDGEVTRKERRAARQSMRAERRSERFKAADTNGDGAISRAEMDAMVMERASRRFARLDANSDGMIDAEEQAQMRGGRGGGHHGRKHGRGMRGATLTEVDANVTRMFLRMDANGDGAVTLEEVRAARGGRLKP